MHMRFAHGFQARLLIVIRTTYFSPCQASLGDSNTQYANIMFCNHSAACCAATSISYILSNARYLSAGGQRRATAENITQRGPFSAEVCWPSSACSLFQMSKWQIVY